MTTTKRPIRLPLDCSCAFSQCQKYCLWVTVIHTNYTAYVCQMCKMAEGKNKNKTGKYLKQKQNPNSMGLQCMSLQKKYMDVIIIENQQNYLNYF